jgi:hypothetical protein
LVDGCEINDYYSALEVAEIKGLTKQAIINGCKTGKYPGAIKSQPDRTNKQGLWLIPKAVIDNPSVELALTAPPQVEQIRSIIEVYTTENKQQQRAFEETSQKRHNEMVDILMRQSQDIQRMKFVIDTLEKQQKKWWKFW